MSDVLVMQKAGQGMVVRLSVWETASTTAPA